jgi:hypothetical protein
VETITLDAREQRRLDVAMNVGTAAQSIEDQANAVALNTENGTIAGTID